MPSRSTGSRSSTFTASSADFCSEEAMVDGEREGFFQAPAIVSSPSRLVVIFSMPSLVAASASAVFSAIQSIVSSRR